MPVMIMVKGHGGIICCRNCDKIMDEEVRSPSPRGYYLFKCKTCNCRIGVAVLALAAQRR